MDEIWVVEYRPRGSGDDGAWVMVYGRPDTIEWSAGETVGKWNKSKVWEYRYRRFIAAEKGD